MKFMIADKGVKMRDKMGILPFVLLFFGTIGLILNEFVLEWGRSATLAFAASNLIGLVILIILHSGNHTGKPS